MKQYNPDKVEFQVKGQKVKGFDKAEIIEGTIPDSGKGLRIWGINKATGKPDCVTFEFEHSSSRQKMVDLIDKAKNKRLSAEDKKRGQKIELEQIEMELF